MHNYPTQEAVDAFKKKNDKTFHAATGLKHVKEKVVRVAKRAVKSLLEPQRRVNKIRNERMNQMAKDAASGKFNQ